MTIELQDVGRCFGSQWAVNEISTSIPRGRSLALLGANGVGKTTLLKLMAGWLPVSCGQLRVDQTLLRTSGVTTRRKLMLLEESRVSDASIVEMITRAVTDYRISRPEVADEVVQWFVDLDLVGIYGKSARALSKGQRFKVAMTTLFVVRPLIWLLDEPFSAGLDANGLAILETEMQSHVDSGGIVVFSTQWPEHARRLANHALVLHQGSVVCDQPIAQSASEALLESAPAPLAAVLNGLGS